MDAQIHFYQEKLRYETDSWDLSEALKRKDKILVKQLHIWIHLIHT